jgi:hypothetical protein
MESLETIRTYLCQEVTKCPSNERSEGFGCQGVLVKSFIVLRPPWNGSSSDLKRVAEKRALDSRILAESWLQNALLGGVWLEGANREKGGDNGEERKKLHLGIYRQDLRSTI